MGVPRDDGGSVDDGKNRIEHVDGGILRALETGLSRPIVDESGITGPYDFSVKGDAGTTKMFLTLLHDQLGLVLTPTTRNIEMVVVRQAK